MLRFKIDENLPIEIADLLREAGYEAETVWSEQIQGFSDIELLGICRNEKRVLVTLDMDFSDIRRYRPEDYQGIILLRIASQGKQSVINLFKKLIPHLRYHNLIGYLWIVQKDRIRIRGPER